MNRSRATMNWTRRSKLLLRRLRRDSLIYGRLRDGRGGYCVPWARFGPTTQAQLCIHPSRTKLLR